MRQLVTTLEFLQRHNKLQTQAASWPKIGLAVLMGLTPWRLTFSLLLPLHHEEHEECCQSATARVLAMTNHGW